ncbi:MAG: ATP-dependent RNA helicase HrpA [Pseudomonadales bacterium]
MRTATLDHLNLALAPDLPVSAAEDEISAALQAHQVVIVAGETGSGKTTQLPKICLKLGLGEDGLIGHTQPRRLAARTVSQRIAEELGVVHGQEVGFSVRFSEAVSDQTVVKVMTDGILLTEIRRDPLLKKYSAIIVDEAHERSLNIDFLLGVLRRILPRRPQFKVIVTSATIDVERFSRFFADAPVISVGGRTYPVEVVYRTPPEDLAAGIGEALEDIETRPHQGASDVLVFLTGERDIFDVARALRKQFDQRLEILPLYARLSVAEQKRVFQTSSSRRRVVLATNVAETSITVPNIGFVIDPGFVRINRYSYRSKLQRLPVEPISQASANQRKGRCGRIAPGVCFRLYDEQDYLSRPAYTDPEIRRVNLASVVLQMHAYRLGDIKRFPFIDPPEPRAVKDALRLLEELRAIEGGKLTATGKVMARMPVDPRLARMLVVAQEQGALQELLVIAAALSVQDPRERPLQKTQAADQSHTEFADSRSDFMAWLNLWTWLEEQRGELSQNRFRRLLARKFIHPMRVREWREVHRQLRLVCRDLGYRENEKAASYAAIHESVIAGSLSLVAQHDERGNYLGARNLKLRIFPGSALKKSPRWIVSAEIAETARVYGRCVAAVEPAWIERQAAHLVKRQYSEPHWSLQRGEVLARLSVTLYGLRLAENRLVSYARVDADLCRSIFIRDGLVHGAVDPAPDFLAHNLALVREIQDLEEKSRRRDLLISEADLCAFYEQRLPADMARIKDLRRWLRRNDDAGLYMQRDMLLRGQMGAGLQEAYPAEFELNGLSLKLHYRFAPGEKDDGVSVDVPIGLLPGINTEVLEWSVPGFFPRVIEQWLRSLPKSKRKPLAPVADKVDEISAYLLDPERYRRGRLASALKTLLQDWYKLDVDEQDWDRQRIEPHLLVNVRVLDEQGKLLRQGRNSRTLKSRFAASADESRVVTQKPLTELQAIPAGKLVDYELLGSKRAPVMKFPGLADRQTHVDLVMFDSRAARAEAHRQGLARLVLLKLGQVSRYFRKELDKHPKLGLHYATLGNADDLKREILLNVAWYCFLDGRSLPMEDAELEQRVKELRPQLATVFSQTVEVLDEMLALRFTCQQLLGQYSSKGYQQSREDAQTHLARLVPADVLSRTSWPALQLKPRYLAGLVRRLKHLPGHVPQDLKRMADVAPLEASLAAFKQAELYDAVRGDQLLLLAEELRLALFAEPLARQRPVAHPLDSADIAQPWKASLKRVRAEIKRESDRLGLT